MRLLIMSNKRDNITVSLTPDDARALIQSLQDQLNYPEGKHLWLETSDGCWVLFTVDKTIEGGGN